MMLSSIASLAAAILFLGGTNGWSLSSRHGFHPHLHRHTSVLEAASSSSLYRTPSNHILWAAAADNDESLEEEPSNECNEIDVDSDPRLFRCRLSRAAGIEWGTDLSFAFVYVREMDPSGEAALSGKVQVGDQLCELRAVVDDDDKKSIPVNLVGAPFDFVMENFAALDRSVSHLDLVFFRGTRDELKAAASGGDGNASKDSDTVTVTVIESKGSPEEKVHKLTAPAGVNVRQLCVDNGINVYQSFTRWTNCEGKQLCGTCIVNITEGAMGTNRKSMDEESTLRENPDSYRLSCITQAYGDVTIETFPPIKAAQWTR